jgi:hypothetical protein
MAEKEAIHLRQCLERGICPTCGGTLVNRIGSGHLSEGVFCSLDCCAKWHEVGLLRRHQDRLKKAERDG